MLTVRRAVTVKVLALVAVPAAVVTLSGPVVAAAVALDISRRQREQEGVAALPGPVHILRGLVSHGVLAHEQDIVHCDFKPSNAFLCRDGKVKVLDFGIARAAPSLMEKGDTTKFDAGAEQDQELTN